MKTNITRLARVCLSALSASALVLTLASTGATAAPSAPTNPTPAATATTADPSVDALASGIERYLVKKDKESVFDVDKARKAKESEDIIEAGQAYNELRNAYTGPKATARSFSLPIWGKYCGPGHSGPGEPVDTLDKLCKEHDGCYGERAYFDCQCDAKLKADIKRLSPTTKRKERIVAAAVRVWFTISPCKKS
ncbi:Phospholipase A2 [Dermatophilus congolensis]|uniref:Phospholipase A2 n=1 Tax=Dermatophilus congolensis TaxID=1863 RepID=A0AA46BLS6_9MICO|nr:phospholipase A2 family protein [Dermatophilus congolensis]STD05181.1 Phospholipase A2 [Dermatophilus congolensis]